MKSIKLALLAGAALAVTTAGAQADDLEALKAQIEELNTRVAAMEAAPAVPTGYQLVAISEGQWRDAPGRSTSNRDRYAFGDKATVISVLPTADAPAGATISWSGYARAGLVYSSAEGDRTIRAYDREDGQWVRKPLSDALELDAPDDVNQEDFDEFVDSLEDVDIEDDDVDVYARGRIRVQAATDTAVGEVGVIIRFEADFDGNGNQDMRSDVAWGYWSMTPELTFGGGYDDSLGQIGFGYDGACSCYYTDNADVAFNPGDTSQMRLTYASGPLSMAVALEDASRVEGTVNDDKLGVAGEFKYSGDTISGEIAGVWRDQDEEQTGAEDQWQVGAGLAFGLADVATLSLAAAMGEGPFELVDEGEIVDELPYNQSWWGVSALASFNLTDEVHAELGAGYKNREGDDFTIFDGEGDAWDSDGADYDTYAILAGLYYQPVDQLTIGIEGEWYNTQTSFTAIEREERPEWEDKLEFERDVDNFSVDLVSVWRF